MSLIFLSLGGFFSLRTLFSAIFVCFMFGLEPGVIIILITTVVDTYIDFIFILLQDLLSLQLLCASHKSLLISIYIYIILFYFIFFYFFIIIF